MKEHLDFLFLSALWRKKSEISTAFLYKVYNNTVVDILLIHIAGKVQHLFSKVQHHILQLLL